MIYEKKYTKFIEILHDEIQRIKRNIKKIKGSNNTQDLTAYWLSNECWNRSIALIYIGLDSLDV